MAYDDKLVTYLGFEITAQDLNKFKEYKKLQKQAAAGFSMPAQAAWHTKVSSQYAKNSKNIFSDIKNEREAGNALWEKWKENDRRMKEQQKKDRIQLEKYRRQEQLRLNEKMERVLENYGDYDNATVAWATRRKRLHNAALRLLDYDEKQTRKELAAKKKAKAKWQNDTRLTLASLGIFSRGFLPLWALGSAVKKGVEYTHSISENSALFNISTEKAQAIDRFAIKHGIDPSDLYSAINKYREAKQAYRMPADKLLEQMIKEAKSPNAHPVAANMNGVKPKVFNVLKEYTGDIIKELNEIDTIVITDEEIKKLDDILASWNNFILSLKKFSASASSLVTLLIDAASDTLNKFKMLFEWKFYDFFIGDFIKDVKDTYKAWKKLFEYIGETKTWGKITQTSKELIMNKAKGKEAILGKFAQGIGQGAEVVKTNAQSLGEFTGEKILNMLGHKTLRQLRKEMEEEDRKQEEAFNKLTREQKHAKFEELEREKEREKQNAQTGPVTINNNFNFESFGDNTPQEISELIQSSIEEKLKNMFGDSSLTSMIGITPATVS